MDHVRKDHAISSKQSLASLNPYIEFGGISTSSGTQQLKPMKASKRHEKRANQEAKREQRIQEKQNNVVSDWMVENELLEGK